MINIHGFSFSKNEISLNLKNPHEFILISIYAPRKLATATKQIEQLLFLLPLRSEICQKCMTLN